MFQIKMAAFPRVVCWQNREEWLEIYQYLYRFEEPSLQRKAVDRIAAWRSRSSGKLPIAIECTAYLVSACLADDLSSASPSDPTQTRLTLSMALVRFVNGMVDSGQKGLYARSVQSIAEEIGLPDWLVDLRHEATHSQLPSLETLRSGLWVALNWLKDQYWEAQITIHSESEENLLKLLKVYEDKQIEYKKSKKKQKKMKKEEVFKLIQEIVSVSATNNLWSEAVSHLHSGHLLIPSSQTFDRLELDFSEIPVDDVPPRINFPQEVFLLWKPLLEALDQASSEFIPSLTIALLHELLTSGNDERNAKGFFLSALSWLSYILDSCSCNAERNQFRLVCDCDMPWSTLLEICLKEPSHYSLKLLPTVLLNLTIPDDVKQRIEHLVQVFLHQHKIITHETENNNVSSVPQNGLREIVNEIRKKQNQDKHFPMTTQSKPWSLADGPTQWQLIPLGEVLGGADVSLDLEDNSSFSCKNMENSKDDNSTLPAVEELDRVVVMSQSDEDETQHHSTGIAEQVIVTDDSSFELEADCTKFPAKSVTDIQRIQKAICLY